MFHVTRLGALCSLLLITSACDVETPPRGPEEICAKACSTRALHCTRHECARGCNFVLDRLAEHEGDHVVACIASTKSSCDDRAWARCATWIGVHADGGPPPPPPPSDFEDDE